jgi:hypothetical protein
LWILAFRHFVGCSDWASFGMVKSAKRRRHLWDAYAFPGFCPQSAVRGVFGDPKVRIITLNRRSKKRPAAVAAVFNLAGMTDAGGTFAICRVATRASS